MGCDVKVAADLEQSLAALDQGWVPSIVLSDYRLDGLLTGIDILTRLRAEISTTFFGSDHQCGPYREYDAVYSLRRV